MVKHIIQFNTTYNFEFVGVIQNDQKRVLFNRQKVFKTI